MSSLPPGPMKWDDYHDIGKIYVSNLFKVYLMIKCLCLMPVCIILHPFRSTGRFRISNVAGGYEMASYRESLSS
jgi:hypothetical protein